MKKNYWLSRIRNKALWVSVLAFIPVLAKGFGWDFLPQNYSDIASGLLGILVLAGLINNPTTANGWFKDE